MEYIIIDRWEGAFAVCEREDGVMIEIPRALLPADCVEGSKVAVQGETYVHLDDQPRREQLRGRLDRLLQRSNQNERK